MIRTVVFTIYTYIQGMAFMSMLTKIQTDGGASLNTANYISLLIGGFSMIAFMNYIGGKVSNN